LTDLYRRGAVASNQSKKTPARAARVEGWACSRIIRINSQGKEARKGMICRRGVEVRDELEMKVFV